MKYSVIKTIDGGTNELVLLTFATMSSINCTLLRRVSSNVVKRADASMGLEVGISRTCSKCIALYGMIVVNSVLTYTTGPM